MTNFENEVWANVADTDGVYQVSTYGRVRTVGRIVRSGRGTRFEEGMILNPTLTRGYPQVTLRRNGWFRAVPVHRLVAETFIPNPDGLPVVDHLNADKTDNRVENLEWATVSENVRRRYGATKIQHGTCSRCVVQIEKTSGNYGRSREVSFIDRSCSKCRDGRI